MCPMRTGKLNLWVKQHNRDEKKKKTHKIMFVSLVHARALPNENKTASHRLSSK